MNQGNETMTEIKPKRKFFTKRDLLIIGALLLVAGGWIFAKRLFADSPSAVEAEIYYNTKMVKTVDLAPGLNEKFAVPGQPDVVLQA